MISRLTLRNFKRIGEQAFDFGRFDLLVGRNNSGKSTVLQALAIWQFAVDEFHRSKRAGSKGIQIVLPNFTALPVPEFNLLWKDRTDRAYPFVDGNRKQEFILIEIEVEWLEESGGRRRFGVSLRYHSPQTMYAIPMGGWKAFRECDEAGTLPRIAYVPPFSGLEPAEKWLDTSPIRQQVGKGQPGSVLRNLLLRVCPAPTRDERGRVAKGVVHPPQDWLELSSVVERWFGVRLGLPQYDSEKDVNISVEYHQDKNRYDIIAGGSGFHQTLTLLAFLYGYKPTTILLDEPDAHLHVNLQREILDYFKLKSHERRTQFLIATHAEEFVRGVDASQIVSLLSGAPIRIQSTPAVIKAMSEVSNEEMVRLFVSPCILYVEGESDERILRAWAKATEGQEALDRICFKTMQGGGKENMMNRAHEHFQALKQIVPNARRIMLFDYDADNSFHPSVDNPGLYEWSRKNIENYFLVPDVWKRAALEELGQSDPDLFSQQIFQTIDTFFSEENLTLPAGKSWRNVTANIFSAVDGKRILFENPDSLFHRLRNGNPSIELIREKVAMSMTADEIHDDVRHFIEKVKSMMLTQGMSD